MDYYCRNCKNIFVPIRWVHPHGYGTDNQAMAVCVICGSNATHPAGLKGQKWTTTFD